MFVPMKAIENKPALVQEMVQGRKGNKPLLEQVMAKISSGISSLSHNELAELVPSLYIFSYFRNLFNWQYEAIARKIGENIMIITVW